MEQVELTPTQAKEWSNVLVKLLMDYPHFTHLMYSMLDNSGGTRKALFTSEVPIAATDSVNVMINPETYFKDFNLHERLFILAHEVMHCIFNHPGQFYQWGVAGKINYPDGTSLPYHPMIMNYAADLVINDMLIESKVGVFPTGRGCHDPNLATHKDSIVDAYRKVYNDCKKKGKGKGKGEGEGKEESQGYPDGMGKNFDDHLKPGQSQGKDPTQAQQERNENEWRTQVAAAMQSAKLQGKLPAAMERLLDEILEPVVDWRGKIQGIYARRAGSGAYDWTKPDRRFLVRGIVTPARSGHGCGNMVVAIDTSGSMTDAEVAMALSEMAGIFSDIKPRKIYVLWCDAEVGRVDEITDPMELYDLKPYGGGGTDFRPVFKWIEKNDIEPDGLVYFTDGYGSFPREAPKYDVIWGNITQGNTNYPFGEIVDIPRRAI